MDDSLLRTYSIPGKTAPLTLNLLQHFRVGNTPHSHFLVSTPKPEVFICKICYRSFSTASRGKTVCPIGPEHHLHTCEENMQYYIKCCQCDHVVEINVEEPVVPVSTLRLLQKNRPDASNFVSCLETFATYVNNLLTGNSRTINVENEAFKKRIKLDEASHKLFQDLGFELYEGHFRPPSIETTKINLVLAEYELHIFSLNVRETTGLPIQEKYRIYSDATSKIFEILGFKNQSSKPPQDHTIYYELLGVHYNAADSVVEWAYNKAIEHDPSSTPEFLDALLNAAQTRKSDELSQAVQMERSQGRYSESDLRTAYAHFEAQDHSIPDEDLIAVYHIHLSERPDKVEEHREALRLIGQARMSDRISQFLSTGKKDWMEDCVYETFIDNTPVGLDNIGNTCYLNSLLQYYFSIRDLRNAVVYSGEFSLDKSKQDGKVITSQDIENAQQFVKLLRDLFTILLNTSERSVAPTLELAQITLTHGQTKPKEASIVDSIGPLTREESQPTEVDSDSRMEQDNVEPSTPQDLNYVSKATDHQDTVEIFENQNAAEISDNQEMIEISENQNLLNIANDQKTLENEAIIDHNAKNESNLSVPYYTPPSLPPRPKAETLSNELGYQQDVTECMDNVMYLLDIALSENNADGDGSLVRQLFFGKTEQTLSYVDSSTGDKIITKKEEDFSHLIVDIAQGRDLYDGLDEYFDNSKVSFNNTEAEREVTITKLPPFLQIQVQRVQFDRTTSNVFKSNAYLHFEKKIYMDRYLAKNSECLDVLKQASRALKAEITQHQETINHYVKNSDYPVPIADMLEITASFLKNEQSYSMDVDGPNGHESNSISSEQMETVTEVLTKAAQNAKDQVANAESKIKELEGESQLLFEDLQEDEYVLHAVFIHQGEATYGHYWIYIYDFTDDKWYKYNDANVTEVAESEVLADTTNSTANPYCIVYVKAENAQQLVDTVTRK
ncbi:ubiquitin-specific protease ubp2 [Basidiobolus ranarum]|uniref:Ubiquitin carboxyl-terminal hydrolase n=1 Tax=Basidiobolus ranarum TaxID=34480 RepID=A0ABR2W9L1_9FUNG